MGELTQDRALKAVACTGQVVGDGLKEILIVPWGTVESKRGTFILDETAAEAIVREFEGHGVALPIDWEHQTLGGAYASPSGRAPAAGWIHKLWWQAGLGLKGLVEWGGEAKKALRDGTYRYLSPVLLIRKADTRAMELSSAALTNKPAIPRMERLAASTRTLKETIVMAEQPPDKNPDLLLGEIASLLAVEASNDVIETLKAILAKVKALVSDEEDEGEIASSVRDLLGLQPDAGKAEITLALTLHDTGGAGTELAAMKGAELERLARERVQVYVDKAVLAESDTRTMEAAMALARENPDRFEALMATRPVYVPQGRIPPPSSRQQMMICAAQDFKLDPALQKTTSVEAYVDLKLRDSGFDAMTPAEARDLAR